MISNKITATHAHESAEGILSENNTKPAILVDVDGVIYPMIELTANHMATVQAIAQYTAQHRIPPTVRDIIAIKLQSGRKFHDGACLGSVKNSLRHLKSLGVIQRKGNTARAIRLVYPLQALWVKP